jgi:hypothetical protein
MYYVAYYKSGQKTLKVFETIDCAKSDIAKNSTERCELFNTFEKMLLTLDGIDAQYRYCEELDFLNNFNAYTLC